MSYPIEEFAGGFTSPSGFMAAGVRADIKGRGGEKEDVAVLYSTVPASAAGVFTTNKVKAAPVILTQQSIASGKLQAIAVNSGNANACTGIPGMKDAETMAALTGQALGIEAAAVAVSSTGVIGVPLPMDRLAQGLKEAAGKLSASGGAAAARAIMTTDTFAKEWGAKVIIGGKTVTVGGMAKGSGMIHPNMATMLSFVATDAAIAPAVLHEALVAANAASFNMITVDGDTSTNDCVLILANGAAGNALITGPGPDFDAFQAALAAVLTHLAKLVAKDGEGATKLLEVQVQGATGTSDARKAARSVAASALVKTAMFGADANWGRILCALGYSGAELDQDRVDLWIGPIQLMQAGAPVPFDEDATLQILTQKEVVIRADLHLGDGTATAWGCDFSYDYVKINGSYRT